MKLSPKGPAESYVTTKTGKRWYKLWWWNDGWGAWGFRFKWLRNEYDRGRAFTAFVDWFLPNTFDFGRWTFHWWDFTRDQFKFNVGAYRPVSGCAQDPFCRVTEKTVIFYWVRFTWFEARYFPPLDV